MAGTRNLRMTEVQKLALRHLAQKRGVTMQSIVHEIIDEYATGAIELQPEPTPAYAAEFGIDMPESYAEAKARADATGISLIEVIRSEIERRYHEAEAA